MEKGEEHQLGRNALDLGGEGVVVEGVALLGESDAVGRQNGVDDGVEVGRGEGRVFDAVVVGALEERLRGRVGATT